MQPSFLLQIEADGYPSEDIAIIHQKIKEHNWLMPNDTIEFLFCKYTDITLEMAQKYIPVGSIEYVERCLQLGHNINNLRQILIPKELAIPVFLGRRITVVDSEEKIKELFKSWNKQCLFIKSASTLKCDYADIYTEKEKLPGDTKYFVSESVNLESEWRVFVYQDSFVDIKNYAGDPWLLPDPKIIRDMIAAYTNSPTAYTLDVGITKEGITALIEVHNFVSCGLYGLTNHRLLSMLVAGYYYELNRAI